jgi:hypothetical protein
MLENRLYAGIVHVPEYGVRDLRRDFEPLVDEPTFFRVQAALGGRVVITSPRERNRPDFPLRGFVRCESCGRRLPPVGRRDVASAMSTITAVAASVAL